MKFWQALVVAQLTAGSIHADRYHDWLPHIIAESSSALFGLVMWAVFQSLLKEPRNDEA